MADKRRDTPIGPAVPSGVPMNDPAATPAYAQPGLMHRASLRAVLAGTLVALMVLLTLSLLGLAIGMTTLGPATDGAPVREVGIGAMIWWIVSLLIALFAGGWIAGRLAGIPQRFEGAIHGILTWGLTTLLVFYLLTTAIGGIVGGALGLVGQGAALAGQGIAAVAPQATAAAGAAVGEQDVTVDEALTEARDLQARVDDERLNEFVSSLIAGEPVTPEERQAAVDALEQETDMTRQEAEQTVDEWIQTSEDVHRQLAEAEAVARQTAEDIAAGIATASFWAFVALVLGAIVAAVGGRMGIPPTALTRTTRTTSAR